MAAMTTKKSNTFSRKAIRIAIAVAALTGLIVGGYLVSTRYFSSQTVATEESPLQTAQATKGDLVLYADGTGTIVPQEESALGFNTSGQVKEISVKVGDKVEAGQILAQLDDTDAQIQLAEAQDAMNTLTSAAAIATAKQTLAAAQSDFAEAKESLVYLISPEVLYWEEKVAEREQILTDAKIAS